jgi:hypothetical protein
MNLLDPQHGLRRVNTADFLSLIALALFVTYVVTVVNAVIPLAILQPTWLVTLISALLDSAPLALLGLGLVHLVAYLEPDDVRIQERRDAVARWAIGAVVGFLLLIPLQAASAYQGVELVARSQNSALKVTLERAEEFRRAIEGAASAEDLQQRIATLQGPGLKLTETNPSLPELKRILNERLDESIRRSREVIESPWNPNLWAIVQRSVRILLLAVVYGLAFAAGSQRRGSDFSLLREAQMQWDLARATRLQRRRERLEKRERQLELQQQDELEARARAALEPPDTDTAPPAPPRVTPSRGLPADLAYFHQLSEAGEEEPERQDPS